MNRTPKLAMTLAAFLISVTPTLADDKGKTNASGAPPELIGAYTIISGEKYGLPEPTERIEGTTVRFAEDAIVVLDKEKKEVYAQTYKIDQTTTPWKITMKSKITPYKGAEDAVAKGLIMQEGDIVKLIYAVPGGDTPTEFKTKEKQLMFVLKNERKKK